MGPVWVIGSGGLLGSAVVAQLMRDQAEIIDHPVHWTDETRTRTDFAEGIRQLPSSVGRPVIIWCAGAGIPSSSASVFTAEIEVFREFLAELRRLPTTVLTRLRIFYASSAGAVYAGVGAPPYDERSPVRPLAPYGDAKLAIEDELRRFSHSSGVRVISGRISNLYGPGQDLTKAQGLISALLMSSLVHKPLQIYVSLDTIRDYLFVADAAELIVASLQRLDHEESGSFCIKVLCSGTGTTISGLLGLVRLVVGRRPLIVQGASRLARVQTRDLSVRSVVWPEIDHRSSTTMLDGLGRTYLDLLQRRCTGL